MVGRTWKDLRPGTARSGETRRHPEPAAGAGAAPRPDPGAILSRVPRLGQLLEQRGALEEHMNGLLAGPGGAVDPREAARFPVMGLPQRRAEHRRWEDRRNTSAADALAARQAGRERPPPQRGDAERRPADTPYARIASWFAQRDEQGQAARDQARSRRGEQAGVRERLDGRVAAGRARIDAARRAERASVRAQDRAVDAPDEGTGSPATDRRERDEWSRARLEGGRRDDDRWTGRRRDRERPTAERLADVARDGGPARDRQAESANDGPRPRRRPSTEQRDERVRAREAAQGGTRTSDLEELGRRAERARERLLGRRSRLRQATRAAARAGERARAMSDRLKALDSKLADAGMDSERQALKDSPVGKLTRALDRTAELATRPQRMVERANEQWERRRDQVAGVLPVDPGFKERVKRMLAVDVGTMESFEERMNRTRDRALRRRDAQRRQEQREEARRERARERSQERRREEARGP